jgi:hypothetical protein
MQFIDAGKQKEVIEQTMQGRTTTAWRFIVAVVFDILNGRARVNPIQADGPGIGVNDPEMGVSFVQPGVNQVTHTASIHQKSTFLNDNNYHLKCKA